MASNSFPMPDARRRSAGAGDRGCVAFDFISDDSRRPAGGRTRLTLRGLRQHVEQFITIAFGLGLADAGDLQQIIL